MDRHTKTNQMIQTELKANSCLCNLVRSSHQRIKQDIITKILNLRIESHSRARIIRARTVRNRIWWGLRMLEHPSRRKFRLQTKIKLFNQGKLARNLITALLNLHLPRKQVILPRTQTKSIKTLSLYFLISVSTEGPISSQYVMAMVSMVNLLVNMSNPLLLKKQNNLSNSRLIKPRSTRESLIRPRSSSNQTNPFYM